MRPIDNVILMSGLGASPTVFDRLLPLLDRPDGLALFDPNDAGVVSGADWSLEKVTRRLAELVEQMAGTVALVAHSLGGAIALALASDPPAKLDRLVILDAGPRYEPAPRREPLRGKLLAEAERLFPRSPIDAAWSHAFGAAMSDDPSLVASLSASMTMYGTERLRDFFVEGRMLQHELAPKALRLPILVVVPCEAQNRDEYEADFRARYAGARDVELAMVEDSGHFVMVDQPAATAALVNAFLAR